MAMTFSGLLHTCKRTVESESHREKYRLWHYFYQDISVIIKRILIHATSLVNPECNTFCFRTPFSSSKEEREIGVWLLGVHLPFQYCLKAGFSSCVSSVFNFLLVLLIRVLSNVGPHVVHTCLK